MTLLMPTVVEPPRYSQDGSKDGQRLASNVATDDMGYPFLLSDEQITYNGSTVGIAKAFHFPFPVDPTTLPLTLENKIYTILMDATGKLQVAEQQQLVDLGVSSDVFYPLYRTSPRGWIRWQPVAGPKLPCLGSSPTIQLVAGANDWGVSSDTTQGTVDGPLGTSRLNAPIGGCFGPDGLLYFIDQGTTFLRYFDPATGQVGTSSINRDRDPGGFGFYRGPSQVFTVGPDGVFYFFVLGSDDNNSQFILSALPDNTDGPTTYQNNFIAPLLGQVSGMFVAPDNSVLYVPCPHTNYYSSSSAFSSLPYRVAAVEIGAVGVGSVFAGADIGGFGLPDTFFGNENSQGEDVPALSGMVGDAQNCYAAPNGDFYTIDGVTRMIRKVSKATGNIRSITNHIPATLASPNPGGFAGDGLPAFTFGDNGFQFTFTNSVTVDPCGNVFISDRVAGGFLSVSSVVRYVDLSGILHTLAGTPVNVADNQPTSTPASALSKTIYDASWIAWGPDGCLYIMCSAGSDLAHYSANAIYKVASS